MNALQTFMAAGNVQTRSVIQEAFTITGEGPPLVSRTGTFGDPVLMPVMTRNGYQDLLVVPLTVEAVLFANIALAEAAARNTIVRTQTGRTMFCQMVDYTAVVVYKFLLTDRQV